ncbi:hypothetical protein WR25_21941 [Diploscapter pachys]|uniref:Uncharacterized protein n=1 Tax=Diploscapter pachys TaxID=2018661 RepID=A0A2A2K506_9BILA|nr:hypothetical protein WR25_21941 [Diploscapter pachys]
MCNAIAYAVRRQARGHAHLIGIRHEANPCYLEKPPEEEAQQGSFYTLAIKMLVVVCAILVFARHPAIACLGGGGGGVRKEINLRSFANIITSAQLIIISVILLFTTVHPTLACIGGGGGAIFLPSLTGGGCCNMGGTLSAIFLTSLLSLTE